MAGDMRSGYVSSGELRMYYETQGDGRPLVLLHGGLTTIEGSFATLRPALARRWKTIALEQQAHGRTADIDRPLRYEQMVEDTAAALRGLGVAAADAFGWSDGGIVGLGLAARHPDLVRKLAIIGAGYNADAEKPEVKTLMAGLRADDPHMAEFRDAYAAVAPRPGDWPALVAKVKAMWAGFAGWTEAEMRALQAPLLVMIGDDDFVRPEHALELFRMVPHGRLAVLPGADQSAPIARSDWVIAMITDFFDAPLPAPAARD